MLARAPQIPTIVDLFEAAVAPFDQTLTDMAKGLAAKIPQGPDHRLSPYFKVHHCITNGQAMMRMAQEENDLPLIAANLDAFAMRTEAVEGQIPETHLRPSATFTETSAAIRRLIPG